MKRDLSNTDDRRATSFPMDNLINLVKNKLRFAAVEYSSNQRD